MESRLATWARPGGAKESSSHLAGNEISIISFAPSGQEEIKTNLLPRVPQRSKQRCFTPGYNSQPFRAQVDGAVACPGDWPQSNHGCVASRPGFTIAEIIVAVIITAFVAGATSIALTQAAKARDASSAKVEARVRAEAAASRIAADVENIVRDAEVFYTRVKLTDRNVSGWSRDELIIYARSLKLARTRTEQGEGGEYEVQYRLDNSGNAAAMNAVKEGRVVTDPLPRLALWRRMDPVPDDIPDGGGVATAIVDGIVSLDIKTYDGTVWSASWESDDLGYPHAVSITVSATDDTGRYEAVCRRVIALDRTPLPVTPVVVEETTPTQNP